METMAELGAIHLLGVRIHCVTYAQAIEQVTRYMAQPGCHAIVTVNPEFLLTAQHYARFRSTLNAAALAVPDGFGLIAVAWLFGYPLRHRVTGIDLSQRIAASAAKHGWSLFLVGGKKGSAAAAARILQQRNPGLRIAGYSPGPYLVLHEKELREQQHPEAETTESLLQRMRATQPDIVLVGFGAPKQEIWMTTYLPSVPSVHVALGVGGTFDILTGRTPRAPVTMRNLGFEWLWRLILQPWRIGRILKATVYFPFVVLFEHASGQHKEGRTTRLPKP